MKLSVTVHRHASIAETGRWAARMESAGIDVFWVGEAYGFDAVSMLGYLAGKISRAEIGSAVLPLYSRSATLTAMTAAGLDFVSSGRFILGLGASGPQVVRGWHGLPYDRPIARTADAMAICRKVWARERLEHQSKTTRVPLPAEEGSEASRSLKILDRPVRADIPIYLAALGPANVALAAEQAEGWLPYFFHPDRVDVWSDAIDKGRRLRKPERGTLEIVAGAPAALGRGEMAEKVREQERTHVAQYVGGMGSVTSNFYNDLFVRYGYEVEAKEIQEHFLAGRRAEAAAAVPDDYLDAVLLVGDEGHVRERIAAYQSAGVTCLDLEIPADYGEAETVHMVEKLRSWCGA